MIQNYLYLDCTGFSHTTRQAVTVLAYANTRKKKTLRFVLYIRYQENLLHF